MTGLGATSPGPLGLAHDHLICERGVHAWGLCWGTRETIGPNKPDSRVCDHGGMAPRWWSTCPPCIRTSPVTSVSRLPAPSEVGWITKQFVLHLGRACPSQVVKPTAHPQWSLPMWRAARPPIRAGRRTTCGNVRQRTASGICGRSSRTASRDGRRYGRRSAPLPSLAEFASF